MVIAKKISTAREVTLAEMDARPLTGPVARRGGALVFPVSLKFLLVEKLYYLNYSDGLTAQRGLVCRIHL